MNLKVRLAVMNFLEFAVWGAILLLWVIILVKLAWVPKLPGFTLFRE